MAREMTCKELVELVTTYLDGSLGGRRRRRFEAHLSACDGCTRYMAQMRETIRMTGRLTEDELTSEQRLVLLGAFRSWRG